VVRALPSASSGQALPVNAHSEIPSGVGTASSLYCPLPRKEAVDTVCVPEPFVLKLSTALSCPWRCGVKVTVNVGQIKIIGGSGNNLNPVPLTGRGFQHM
jgi:hypothetical protein